MGKGARVMEVRDWDEEEGLALWQKGGGAY